jgi:hypothetical protein
MLISEVHTKAQKTKPASHLEEQGEIKQRDA